MLNYQQQKKSKGIMMIYFDFSVADYEFCDVFLQLDKLMNDNIRMRHSDIGKLHQSAVHIDQAQFLQLKKHAKSTPIAKLCSACYSQPIKSYSWSVFTCEHNELCLECLHQYVDHAIQQKNVPKCVVTKCPGQLKINDSQAMYTFTTNLRNRIRQSFEEAELKNNKKCTMPDCYGFINKGTCELCLTNFCENCYNKQHRGECEISELELGEHIKRCPECGEGIERDGGCLHMQCTGCKYNFCFKCRQVWSSRHHITCGTGDSSVLGWILNIFN